MRGRLGAEVVGDGVTRFEVWAPDAERVTVELDGRSVPLDRDGDGGGGGDGGVWVAVVDGVGHGDRYRFCLDGGELLADPASGWQPDGVHGPSAVVDAGRYAWTDGEWTGVELAGAVIYELHVGVFTPSGTLDGVIGELGRLAALGVTVVELMPLAATPGRRNWGYDGVFPWSVHETYGGPDALARLVDAAHASGIAVMLDVVYNHLGPEGNVLPRFGPYLTDAHRTPWGSAVNVAAAGSDAVRRYFVESARRWVEDFHVDGFRLDAIDFIIDPTARPFLEELIAAARSAGRQAGRTALVIAESASNDPRIVRPPGVGGLGFDAMWNDDVHHSLRVAMTGHRGGYYVDYDGVADLATALAHRWVFRGRYSPFRDRHHGCPADDVAPERFVVFSANHDHVGNTPAGARPPYDHAQKLLAAAAVSLSPFTPLLFMGDEYGDPAPFPFFVDHGDPDLLEATRASRREEFAAAASLGEVADPGDPATFAEAVLDPSLAERDPHRSLLAAHTELLRLRRALDVLRGTEADHDVTVVDEAVVVARRLGAQRSMLVLNFGRLPVRVAVGDDIDGALTTIVFDSGDAQWRGGMVTAPCTLGANSVTVPAWTAVLLTND